jgi:hypothetical protein
MQSSTDSVLLSLTHWRLASDANGIGWLCFDRQGAGANTLSGETMAELETCLDALEKSGLKGLVIHSGKARGFIAGADINEFPALDSEARAYAVTRQGQHILARLEALPFPSVAVLNGFALGGGLELALACTRRLAIEGNEPVFGLPEGATRPASRFRRHGATDTSCGRASGNGLDAHRTVDTSGPGEKSMAWWMPSSATTTGGMSPSCC